MKRMMVLTLMIVLGLAFAGFAGPTIGWLFPAGDPVIPLAVGVQYDGAYGFGFGCEVFKANLLDCLSDWTWQGDYGFDGFLTFDLSDHWFALAGVEYVLGVEDDGDDRTVLSDAAFGLIGVGYGYYGHSLRLECVYGPETLRYRAALRMDILGLVRQVRALMPASQEAPAGAE